ncbi:MAG: hypothetical protein RI907_505 [Pseudomonadota bacterium]|jgi:penicillin amidase
MGRGQVLRTAHGRAHIVRSHAQLLTIEGDTHEATYHAQGYATADQRLWQLELSRRLARGALAEILGPAALATDRFQRKLDLTALARRSMACHAQDEERPYLQAYVDGLNHRLATLRVWPLEFIALRHRPEPFSLLDVYLVAHLKYFINSAWQFELHHTLVCNTLSTADAATLFATFDESGEQAPALPGDLRVGFVETLQALQQAAREALATLGLDSPDIGSNAFAVSGRHTRSGFPLLANDPHMGLVAPGFNMFFHLKSAQGLDVCGSNFPGAPGVVVGRNRDIAWGLTGAMMDNQDLYWGEVDLSLNRVRTAEGWVNLDHERSPIQVKGQAMQEVDVRGCAQGQLLHAEGGLGLFLRWPALDGNLGSVSLHRLNRACDWASFREGVAEVRNCPGVAVYADTQHIGAQVYGLMPRRAAGREMAGTLVLPLHDPRWQWQGHVEPDQLPHEFDPPDGVIVHANQYLARFLGDTYISSRWHSPARALRIRELLASPAKLTAADLARIQDDQVDGFARRWLPHLLACWDEPADLPGSLRRWAGDTRDTEAALLFERWLDELAQRVLRLRLTARQASDYVNQWPAWRWNLMAVLWGRDAWLPTEAARALVRQCLQDAVAAHVAQGGRARVAFRHTLRGQPWLRRWFGASFAYAGGSRETISALRRNVDFLTRGQGGANDPSSWVYSFGTSFKLVYDLQPGAANLMLANMPNAGNPLRPFLAWHLRRWRRGQRHAFVCGPRGRP